MVVSISNILNLDLVDLSYLHREELGDVLSVQLGSSHESIKMM